MPLIAPDTLKAAYDVVIVGAGSAGCAVARRLADATDATVLLVEAGSARYDAPALRDPTGWIPLAGGPFDWGHSFAPNPLLGGRRIPIPRGKVLGGSSAINAMMWYRGHPDDYDRWGLPGWAWADCLPAFRACETWEDGPSALRGGDGPLRITRSPDPHPVALAMIEGLRELGHCVLDDPNGPSNDGVALANYNMAGGERWCSARSYLEPVLGHGRLSILADARVVRLLGDRRRISGILVETGAGLRAVEAGARVVLAAGAFETPRLLTLSGLADEADLARLGIPVRAHVPGVGRNLQDHPLLRAVNFRARVPSGPTRDNGGGAIANVRSHAGADRPDIHLLPIQQASGGPQLREAHDLSGDVFALAPGVMDTRSVGSLTVTGTGIDDPLVIDARHLADPADWQAMRRGVELAVELVHTRAFADLFAGLLAPPSLRTPDEIDAFIRLGCATFFHVRGTARMGVEDDPLAVCDARLNVRAVDGLMIADASVIPVIPTCNTHAPVTMIGERAAAFLAADLGARAGWLEAAA